MPETSGNPNCARCGGPCDWRGVCARCVILASLGAADPDVGPEPALRLGQYTLIEELGRGGMGRVWRARQDGLEREVALKTLRAGIGADESTRARFRREALAAARLRHPGIVTVHQVGEAEGEPYLAMELVRGETLAQRLKAGPLPHRLAVTLVREMGDALRHAHAAGVIHRDVKPSNILLDADRNGAPRLTDFGIARLADGDQASLTSTLEGLGTLAYLAPEQASGRSSEQGPATDVYGLGAVLYHCLTGRPPFVGETAPVVLRMVVESDPLGLRSFNPSVPRDLETIALKCLEKQPGRRYAGAGELVDELDRWSRGDPIRARPVGPLSRGFKWCRRRPAWAALGVSVILGVGAVLWQWGRAERNAGELLHQLTVACVGEAEALLVRGQSGRALALLSRTLRRDPTNELPAQRLAHLLTQRAWPRPVLILEPHPGHVLKIAYSPDGSEIITACADGRVRRWDARNGTALGPDREHVAGDFQMLRVAASGHWILSLTTHGSVRVWSWRDAAPVLDLGTTGPKVTTAAFANVGEGLVVAFDDGTIARWQPGKSEPDWRGNQAVAANVIEMDHRGRGFATGSTNGTIVVWNDAGNSKKTLALGIGAAVIGIRFNPDDSQVLISRLDGRAILWDLARDREIIRFENKGEWPALMDGKGLGVLHVLPKGLERTDVASGRTVYRLSKLSIPPYFGPVISPDGLRALAGEDSRDVVPFLVQGGNVLGEPIRTRWEIEDAAFSPDGSRLAVCAGTNTVVVWEIGRRPAGGRTIPLGPGTRALGFSQDSRWVLRLAADGVIHRYSLNLSSAETSVPLGRAGVRAAAFNEDGSRVAVVDGNLELGVFHTETGKRMAGPWPVGDPEAIAFSRDGHWLAVGTSAARLHWFDLVTGRDRTPAIDLHAPSTNPGGGTRVMGVEFSPDSRNLAIASYSGVVWLADPVAGRVTHTLGLAAPVACARFSPDSRRLATACYSGAVQFWDAATGQPEAPTLPGDTLLHDVAWSPLGDRVAAASDNGTVRVWSVSRGALLSEVNQTTPMRGVAFHPNGARIASVGGADSGRVWDTASGRAVTDVLGLPAANRVAFSPDGHWLALYQTGGDAFLYRMYLSSGSPPPWLAEVAETLAGQRLGADDQIEVLPPAAWVSLAARLGSVSASDEWGRWLAEFMAADTAWISVEPSVTPPVDGGGK